MYGSPDPFNLNEDPAGTANLIRLPEYAAQAQRLRALLAGWMARTRDPFTLPGAGQSASS